MLHLPLVIRQIKRSSKQAILYVLCVALSLSALTAFSGFAAGVSRALRNDARSLHGADIIIKSYDPISAPLHQAMDALVAKGHVLRADLHEFLSVVRALDEGASVLAGLKVVAPGYPFYGQVELASGKTFQKILTPGTVVVAQGLLDRLGISVGDPIKVGFSTLTVVDVVTAEPDRPINFFSFGPRMFVHADDLDALGLIKKGGRIRRVVLLKVLDPERIDDWVGHLKQSALPDQEQVDTFETAGSRIKRFLDSFFFFLKLVGLFVLLIAGLGIQGTLNALLKEKQPTIAIMKTVGASNRFIAFHFISLVGLLGMAGTLLGIVLGIWIQEALAGIMAPYLPTGMALSIAWSGVLEGLMLGGVVVAVFSYLPLYRIKSLRPMVILRDQHRPNMDKRPYYWSVALVLIFFFGLVWWHMREVRFGVYFVGASTTLVLAAALLAHGMLRALARHRFRSLILRQAVKGLFRQGSATRAIIITLTSALSVIFATHLLEKNLASAYVRSYPAEAPNAYFVDIQPHQRAAFIQAVERPAILYPIVRARVMAINNQPIDRRAERQKRRDNFARVFNLTYRHHLLADEQLVKGKTLFAEGGPTHQVSILDTVAEMHPMKVGDTIRFNIQGVPLEATIASIRTRESTSFSPFFYFVFPEQVLARAPHTLFAALKVPSHELGALQGRIVSRFPNISVIDITQTVRTFTRLIQQLSRIIRAFSAFSILAGLLILISAIYATRAERVKESVYYKILGAGKAFVFKVFALESVLIGLLSSAMALIIAHGAAYWVCRFRLDVPYHFFMGSSVGMVAATLVLVALVGLTASKSIMAKRPVIYLREQNDA